MKNTTPASLSTEPPRATQEKPYFENSLWCVVEAHVVELNHSFGHIQVQSNGTVLDFLFLGQQIEHVFHVNESLLNHSEIQCEHGVTIANVRLFHV